MPDPIPSQSQEPPGGVATPQDSTAGGGVQPGGVPDKLDQLLSDPSEVTPGAAQTIRSRLAEQTAAYTRKTQTLADDVQVAGAFRKLRQDPRFNDFLNAVQTGDLAGYHRRSLGVTTVPGTTGTYGSPADAQPGAADGAPDQTARVEANKANLELRQEVQALQSQLNDHLTQQQAEAFTKTHPTWQEHAPEVMKELQTNPYLNLHDAYTLAMSRNGLASPTPAAVEGNAPTEGLPQQPPMVSSPAAAPSVTSQAGEPPIFDKKLGVGLAQAFEWAQKQQGVKLKP